MQTFDIVSKKYIILVQIDSMVLFYGVFLTTRTKMGMIRQRYNGIEGINFRANAKRFSHKTKKKITSCQL